MKHFWMTAVLALGTTTVGSTAMAQSISDQVISSLRDQGYSRIEVKNGISQVKVEAIRGNRELEVVYDKRTGAILKQEVNVADSRDRNATGIEVRDERRDFVSARNNDDDDRGLGGNGRRMSDDDDDDDRGRGRGRGGRDGAHDDDDDDDRGRGRGRGGRDDDDDDDDRKKRDRDDDRRDRDDDRRDRDDDDDDDD
ncbi:hypothetical protein AN189_15630 [Loktanella sp. 3ANDIMAR09]|uniref:PepSY domain-containing protein n=1 Tax=Loktanella sp. 3ANDIMAR09 TaxID=1225657 RepID=UPI0006F5D448|nr:PepSY domain-containing protein [Loktanella sp. 3ANDIMAR09]KQI67378.1 hypothetical protein AN189_15630 [Loktanella sp. 3ANDIMAR09]